MNVFTKTLTALNFLGAVISVLLFSSTFFAKGIITQRVQKIALEKTRAKLESAIPATEKLLSNPIINKAIPEKAKEKLTQEIADFQSSPEEWMTKLVKGGRERAKDFDFPEIKNPIARKSLDVLKEKIEGAGDHFQASAAALVKDLRIFSGVNTCSFLIAAAMCFYAKTPTMRLLLGSWSAILLIATIMSINFYIDQNWVWKFMSNSYGGWEYLVGHLFITGFLTVRCGPELWGIARSRRQNAA
jgi:hypothetical protein